MANELCVRHRTTITDDAIFLIFLNTSCLSQSKLNIAFGHLFYTLKDELSYSLLIQEDLEVLPFRFFSVSFIALYDFTFLCSVPEQSWTGNFSSCLWQSLRILSLIVYCMGQSREGAAILYRDGQYLKLSSS